MSNATPPEVIRSFKRKKTVKVLWNHTLIQEYFKMCVRLTSLGSCCWNSCAYGEILSADSRTEPVTCLTIVCGSPSASGPRAVPPANLPTVALAYSKIKPFWEINMWCSGWRSILAGSIWKCLDILLSYEARIRQQQFVEICVLLNIDYDWILFPTDE